VTYRGRVAVHPIAFLDVDETLVAMNSMGSFLVAYLTARGRTDAQVRAHLEELMALDVPGAPRDAVSRAYYASFAGQRADDLLELGEKWFVDASARPGLFHAVVAREVRALQADRALVVLVSGAPAATLSPLARAIGADAWFGTVQRTRDGVLTGEVDLALVGEAKAQTVRSFAQEHGVAPDDCIAYGDHASDLPMLLAAGTGVVVGEDPTLTAVARDRGWRTLSRA